MPTNSPMTRIENAVVWTGVRSDGGIVESDAIAFTDDGILALGDAARALAADHVIDAGGGFVCSAFRDGHVHAIPGGFEHAIAPVRDHSTPQEIAAAVGRWAAEHPEVEWVRGEGFDHTLAPGGIFLADVARCRGARSPGRPACHGLPHGVGQLRGAAPCRVHAQTPQPHDGEIVRDDDGAPVGHASRVGRLAPGLRPHAADDPRAGPGCAGAGLCGLRGGRADVGAGRLGGAA